MNKPKTKDVKKVTIIAMRHGESQHNVRLVVNGDPKKIFHLTPKGRKQAVELSKKLKVKSIKAIIASQMLRTQETAAPLAKLKNIKVQVDKRLNDIHAGGLEGINIFEFRRLTGEIHKSVKKSETGPQVEKRLKSFLKDVLKKYNGQTIAIVSSEILLHALQQIMRGEKVNEAHGRHIKNGVAYTFHLRG